MLKFMIKCIKFEMYVGVLSIIVSGLITIVMDNIVMEEDIVGNIGQNISWFLFHSTDREDAYGSFMLPSFFRHQRNHRVRIGMHNKFFIPYNDANRSVLAMEAQGSAGAS